jgi:uncharacterized membrane protein (DUF485 family)
MEDRQARLEALAAARARVVARLCAAMFVLYFGFILLIAFQKPLLGRLVAPGLSLGILLGALVIVASWGLTFAYVRWANRHYDGALARLRE